MTNLSLRDEEVAFLVELLDTAVSDLRTEITHTDSLAFKQTLRDRKALLLGLIEKLKGVPAEAGAKA